MKNFRSIANENIVYGPDFRVKRSHFWGFTKQVSTIEDAEAFIDAIKAQHPDAGHNVSAYIIDTKEYYHDDKEPLDTAGKSLLTALHDFNLNYTAIVVTRYFGGVLLGKKGLATAYLDSAIETLKKADIVTFIEGYKVELTFPENKSQQMSLALEQNHIPIIEKHYADHSTFLVFIKKNKLQQLKDLVANIEKTTTVDIIDGSYMPDTKEFKIKKTT